MAKVIKELTPKQSTKKIKSLLDETIRLDSRHFAEGNLIFCNYSAKDTSVPFDKTPLMLVLRRGPSHTLGLNFHWLPYSMRLNLIKYILKINENNIRRGRPLEFNYKMLKPMLKGMGYAPVIRLYINKRISKKGVVIPPDRLLEVARLRTETITGGIRAETIYKKIRKKARAS
jgi:hypothetical protein